MKALGLLILLVGSIANAQFVISPSVSYMSSKVTDNTNSLTVESNATVLDARVGYIMPMGFYFGGMYTNISGSSGTSGYSIGPTIGYHDMSGFYGLLTYKLAGQYDYSTSGIVTSLKNPNGPQVDIGWIVPVTSMFHVGPQMTWSQLNYKKASVGGVDTTIDTTYTDIRPYITFWFMF